MPYRVFFVDRESRTNTFDITEEYSGVVTGLYRGTTVQSDVDNVTLNYLSVEESIHIGTEFPVDATIINNNDHPVLIKVRV